MKSCLIAALALCLVGCSHVSTVRLQPDAVDVGPRLRPIAGIQAAAGSFYVLFIPIPGVELDKVVNKMLIATAKAMGADKVTNVQFSITPGGGAWTLLKILGYRRATASGIAVQVTGVAADPAADEGPEPVVDPSPSPATLPTPASGGGAE